MITPLRRRHRWLAPGAFGLALAGWAAAIAVRPDPSWMSDGASGHSASKSLFEERDVLLVKHGSGRFSVAVGEAAAGVREVWLLPSEALDIPDLLVYSSELLGGELVLPSDARLLGPAAQGAPTRFEVPLGTTRLLLFSLGHQAVEADIVLEAR